MLTKKQRTWSEGKKAGMFSVNWKIQVQSERRARTKQRRATRRSWNQSGWSRWLQLKARSHKCAFAKSRCKQSNTIQRQNLQGDPLSKPFRFSTANGAGHLKHKALYRWTRHCWITEAPALVPPTWGAAASCAASSSAETATDWASASLCKALHLHVLAVWGLIVNCC